ncbi:hypothetical protein A33M_3581 [Rhodovulum sp. PH10]|nr:hypothetical protein A33M_3581 [Rhodovulum sp. PH10]
MSVVRRFPLAIEKRTKKARLAPGLFLVPVPPRVGGRSPSTTGVRGHSGGVRGAFGGRRFGRPGGGLRHRYERNING